jgi:hypothetical protein
MLDYRAHKLYWLIFLPFRIISFFTFYAVVFFTALIAQPMQYHVLIRIVVFFVAVEAITALLTLTIFAVVFWAVRSAFFWIIDVIPAHGSDPDEARAVVIYGPTFTLNKKYETTIERWTSADTDALVATLNWRSRFFPIKERLTHNVAILKRIYSETGKEPRDLGQDGMKDVRKKLFSNPSWFETAIVSPPIFRSIVAFVLITIIIGQGN